MTSDDVDLTRQLYEAIRPLLAGHPPQVQGAVLADLLATWLAGHYADSDADTDRLRETIFAKHSEIVWELVPVNDAIIHGTRR
jgi:hypothetical protein